MLRAMMGLPGESTEQPAAHNPVVAAPVHNASRNLTRGRPKPRPAIDKAFQEKAHREFLEKPVGEVERNIKGQTAGSVASRVEAADLTRTPPTDYYMCAQVYLRILGQRTDLVHSLCTWWAQNAEAAPERALSDRASGNTGGGLFCTQIRKPRQCYRFRGDPFLQHPRLNDFTKQCNIDCLGRMVDGSREGVG